MNNTNTRPIILNRDEKGNITGNLFSHSLEGRGRAHCARSPGSLIFYQAFTNGWFKDYPQNAEEIPSVGLHPIKDGEKEGYVVQKLLVLK